MPDLNKIQTIHAGRHLHVHALDYILSDGRTKTYEITSAQKALSPDTLGRTCNGVTLLVQNPDRTRILLAQEFRLGVGRVVLNSIAGYIDPGETPEQAALRELREESGLTDVRIIKTLPMAFPCPSVTDMAISLVICQASGEPIPSDNPAEPIQARWFSRAELESLLQDPNTAFSAQAQALCLGWVLWGDRGTVRGRESEA